jgi:hypothetical protein
MLFIIHVKPQHLRPLAMLAIVSVRELPGVMTF